MRFSAECRFWFFLGWVLLWAGAWGVIGAEALLRIEDQYSFYVIEAWSALLVPIFAVVCADIFTMNVYRSIWRDFSQRGLGTRVVELEHIARLREEMSSSLLLIWLRPPVVKSIPAQLRAVSLWYLPLIQLPGSSIRGRFHEQISAVALFFLVLPAGFLALRSPAEYQRALALSVLGLCLLHSGYLVLKLTARRQAVLDYFSAWRSVRDEVS